MTKYLLLRDNKQTGPYDLDELRTKGLKAYDLVWIDGKSAAWRYPSEVEELKPFAPVVEEQPFDRFYKKTPQENTPAKESIYPSSIVVTGAVVSPDPSSIPGKRIIYVTLPAKKGGSPVRETPSREPVKIQPSFQEAPTPAPTHELSSLYVTPVQAPAEEKFSQGHEDMWKSAVESSPRSRKAGMSRILQPIGVIVCVLALLAAGIFIGLSINRNSFGFTQKFAAAETPGSTKQIDRSSQLAVPVNQPSKQNSPPSNPVVPPPADTLSSRPPAARGNVLVAGLPAEKNTSLPVEKKKTGKTKDKSQASAQKDPGVPPVKDTLALNVPVLHREATHRTDAATDKDAIKNNIANLVSVGSSKYIVGTFGGISELQLTVSNRSIYPLDLVVVEVQYIQANKKVYRTENLNFRDIGAGGALMLEAPKSSRGIKVQYKIMLINSKELGVSYSAI